MTLIISEIHYAPSHWSTNAHTSEVRKEFTQLLQFSLVSILETVVSPILTPYVMICALPKRALDFVDFFRNFTVEVEGVGDVCSFAQMDVRKHGNAQWLNEVADTNQYQQAEGGKTELSLLHF